jgi:hypothetical protein
VCCPFSPSKALRCCRATAQRSGSASLLRGDTARSPGHVGRRRRQRLEAKVSGTVTGLGLAAIFISVAGIGGGALAKGKPKAAAILQAASGVLGFVAVSAFWLISGPLLLLGAVFAFLGTAARQPVTTLRRA